jgi:hypothetical protein
VLNATQLSTEMNLIRFDYAMQGATAHTAAPVMRTNKFPFLQGIAWQLLVHMLICRVSTHLRVEFSVSPFFDLFKVELQSAILFHPRHAFSQLASDITKFNKATVVT